MCALRACLPPCKLCVGTTGTPRVRLVGQAAGGCACGRPMVFFFSLFAVVCMCRRPATAVGPPQEPMDRRAVGGRRRPAAAPRPLPPRAASRHHPNPAVAILTGPPAARGGLPNREAPAACRPGRPPIPTRQRAVPPPREPRASHAWAAQHSTAAAAAGVSAGGQHGRRGWHPAGHAAGHAPAAAQHRDASRPPTPTGRPRPHHYSG